MIHKQRERAKIELAISHNHKLKELAIRDLLSAIQSLSMWAKKLACALNIKMETSTAWAAYESGNYELARSLWADLLASSKTQQETDSVNWGMGYALVKLKQFSEAKKIWEEIFSRTNDHKALHQIGMVERESGNHANAFEIYLKESELIDESDILAKAVNLYELSYCSHLKADTSSALRYLDEYRKYTGKSGDLIEEACFFRLEGDIFAKVDTERAKASYELSLKKFQAAEDTIGASEIFQRLKLLET